MGCSCSSPKEPSLDGQVRKDIYSPGALTDKYELTGKVLGQGTFGIVKVGLRKAPEEGSEEEIAIKAVQLYRDTMFGGRTMLADLEILETEIAAMRAMGSQSNMLTLFDAYRTPSQVQFVLEYAKGGSLLDRLLLDDGFSELKARAACPTGCCRHNRVSLPQNLFHERNTPHSCPASME
jgi:serine/threonine protein kinase